MGHFAISSASPGDRSPMTTKTVEFLESPRLHGSLQALGGLAEISTSPFLVMSGPFTGGAGIALAGLAVMHGTDHLVTGAHMAFTGKPHHTLTSQMLQKTGMSPEAAQLTDAGIGVIATMGAARAIQGTELMILCFFHRMVSSECDLTLTTHMEIRYTFTLSIRLEENGKMHHLNIEYIRKMNNKKRKRFEYRKNNAYYLIEEDLVGWYLIVYNDKNTNKSSEDHLFDTLEDAMFEGENRFSIPKNSWKAL